MNDITRALIRGSFLAGSFVSAGFAAKLAGTEPEVGLFAALSVYLLMMLEDLHRFDREHR